MKFKTSNQLESIWTEEHPWQEALGLYFDTSKSVNLALNFSSEENQLEAFNQGLKIDIDPLHRIENRSPDYEISPELIRR